MATEEALGPDCHYTENSCVICFNGFKDDDINNRQITLTKKGLENVMHYSKLRCDSKVTDCLLCLSGNPNATLFVHQKCRRNYTDPKRLKVAEDNTAGPASPKKIKLRSNVNVFNWKKDCFFCSKSTEPDPRHPERTGHIQSVCKKSYREVVLQKCKERNDVWSVEVDGRLQLCFDLVAADAVYHKSCQSAFMLGKYLSTPCKESQKVGRPQDSEMLESFNKMCQWLESRAGMELTTLTELRQHMIDLSGRNDVYSNKRLKQKLEERYKDQISFAGVDGKCDVVCFHETAKYIINDKWYGDRKKDASDDAKRIIQAAAKLIKAEILNMEYSTNLYYPTSDEMKDINFNKEWIPPSLQTLLEMLLSSKLKQVTIGQCIIHATRPRSAIPPVLLGLGVELDHVFGSKWLVNELSRMGFSVTYDEVIRYKQSAIQDDSNESDLPIETFPGSFTQWVADNIDHNVATLDGHGTFHGMGIITVSTCTTSHVVRRQKAICRLKRIPVKDLIMNRGIPVISYQTPQSPGLASIVYKPLHELQFPYTLPPSLSSDLVWQTGWMFKDSVKWPSWSGFMQEVSDGNHPPSADIHFLPIIDLNPSDDTCIYSTLLFVQKQAKNLNIETPCITFDQPLWIKSVEIIKAKSLNIVCRLGGFHMMMSFLGSIGSVMNGSGLAEVLETVYGPNAVNQMLTGHAVARAIRGHMLVDAALIIKLMQHLVPNQQLIPNVHLEDAEDMVVDNMFDNIEVADKVPEGGHQEELEPKDDPGHLNIHEDIHILNGQDVTDLKHLYESILQNKATEDDITDSKALQKLRESLDKYKHLLSNKSRTAKLWLQYMHYIEILRSFIRAERTGNWHLHLTAVSKMINLFAATGHNNYAKSARLYLQMMLELPETHPWLYDKFMNHGYHTVRRSDRYWAGLWTDLIIEQVLMRSLKSRGGLTRGRGITESVRLTWVYSMHTCASIHDAMTTLTNLLHVTNDQHADLGKARISRDCTDISCIISWFDTYEPFDMSEKRLQSLASGLMAEEDDGINCDEAEEVGSMIQHKLDNVKVSDVSMKKADQVKTLVTLQKGIKVGQQTVYLDASNLFSRLITLVERNENMVPYFEYELTAFPTSLFKDFCMRKPNKAVLAHALLENVPQAETPPVTKYVLDGGALLHRVKWKTKVNYQDIVNQYLKYVDMHYGKSVIVFDGYGDGPSTKDHEHQRRSYKRAAFVKISELVTVHANQQAFLANEGNKTQFIALLARCLKAEGHQVCQSAGDADTEIVSSAIQLASVSNQSVTVVSDDTDVTVLLLYHFKPELSEIYVRSEAKKCHKKGLKLYNIRDAWEKLGNTIIKHLLFIHAWGGCDTTSALFGHGKTAILKKVQSSEEIRKLSDIFNSCIVGQEEITEAGLKLLVMLYGGKSTDTLNYLRYTTYMRMAASGTSTVQPERLPPTERAASFHCFRIYLQIIQWKSLTCSGIDPTKWGWKLENGRLVPVQTDLPAGPQDILRVIRCKCKSSKDPCGSVLCSCRKNGLKCVAACWNCHGDGCRNMETIVFSEDSTENEYDA